MTGEAPENSAIQIIMVAEIVALANRWTRLQFDLRVRREASIASSS